MKKLITLFLLGSVMSQAWMIQDDPYYKHRKSQFEQLMNNERYETMMLGDSITDEGQWDELLDNTKKKQRN